MNKVLVVTVLALSLSNLGCKSLTQATVKSATAGQAAEFAQAVGSYTIDYTTAEHFIGKKRRPVSRMQVDFTDDGAFTAQLFDGQTSISKLKFTLGFTSIEQVTSGYTQQENIERTIELYSDLVPLMADLAAKYPQTSYLNHLVSQNLMAMQQIFSAFTINAGKAVYAFLADGGSTMLLRGGSDRVPNTLVLELSIAAKDDAKTSLQPDKQQQQMSELVDGVWSAVTPYQQRAPTSDTALISYRLELDLRGVDETRPATITNLTVSYLNTGSGAFDHAYYELQSFPPMPRPRIAKYLSEAGKFRLGLAAFQQAAGQCLELAQARPAKQLLQVLQDMVDDRVPTDAVANATFKEAQVRSDEAPRSDDEPGQQASDSPDTSTSEKAPAGNTRTAPAPGDAAKR